MSGMAKRVMERFYREAQGDPTQLPWHHETPSPFVAQALERERPPRRALDVGCGSGLFAAHLAELGLEVTAVDYLADAVAMARALVAERGVEVAVVQADVLEYAPQHAFDLVFDSGCLHNFSGRELGVYRSQVLRWLEPEGDFVLAHWGRRHALDWRPIGPRRRTPAELERLFAPELRLLDSESVDEKVPLPFGPRVRMASYWFRRGVA